MPSDSNLNKIVNLVNSAQPRRNGRQYRSQRQWESSPEYFPHSQQAPPPLAQQPRSDPTLSANKFYKPTVKTAAFAPTAIVGDGTYGSI